MVENLSDDLESVAPELWVLLQAWRDKGLQGRAPRPEDILPRVTGRWLQQGATVIPDRRAGFLIATCGMGLIRRFGCLAVGHRVSTLAPGIRQPLARRLLMIRRDHRPVVWRPTILLGRDPITFSEMILPLSDDGQTVSLMLLAALEHRRPKPKPPPEPEFYEPDWEHD